MESRHPAIEPDIREQAVDETSSLLAHDAAPSTSKTLAQYLPSVSTVVNLSVGATAFGCASLYIVPAIQCAESATCGLFWTNIVGKTASIITYAAMGAFPFVACNVVLAVRSVPEATALIKRQPSWGMKLGVMSGITVYAVSQSASTLIALKTTSPPLWQTIVALAGMTPGLLYSSTQTIDAFSNYYGVLKQRTLEAYGFTADQFRLPTPEELDARLRIAHYRNIHTAYLSKLNNCLRTVRTHPREIFVSPSAKDDLLAFLFEQVETPKPAGAVRYVAHKAGSAAGIAAGLLLSHPFFLNSFFLLCVFMPIEAAAVVALYLSYSFIYSNSRLLQDFMHGIIHMADVAITSLTSEARRIESLSIQLYPKSTAMVLIAIALISSMSYSLINLISEMIFPEDTTPHRAVKYSTDLTMIGFHGVALFHLYEICIKWFAKLLKNHDVQTLCELETKVQTEMDKPLSAFIKEVEARPAATNAFFETPAYQRSRTLLTMEAGNNSLAARDVENMNNPDANSLNGDQLISGSWLSQLRK